MGGIKNTHLNDKKIENSNLQDNVIAEKKNDIKEELFDGFQEMLETNRFKSQKKHIFLHTVLVFAFLCYTALLATQDVRISVFGGLGIFWLIMSHCIDYALCRKKYKKNGKFLIASKVNLLMSIVFFSAAFANDRVIALAGLAVYLLHVMEYIECIDFTNSLEKERAALVVSCVFAAVYVIVVIVAGLDFSVVEIIFMLGIVCAVMFCIIEQIYQYTSIYTSYISKLNNDNSDLTILNDQIKDQSKKIKEAVDLLGVQKIELSKANEMIQMQNDEMKLHNDILAIVSKEKDMNEICPKVAEVLLTVNEIDMVGIFVDALMYGNQHPMLYTRVPNHDEVEELLAQRASDILLKVHHFDENYRVYNSSLPDRYDMLQAASIRSMIEVQIMLEGGMCGAFVVGSSKLNYFKEENIAYFESVATQLAIAVNNANLYSTMENLATRDGLTGIYNRRHFNKLFNDYVSVAMDKRQPIAAALFDIDKFKNVNDTYGHSFGDLVIVTVSHIANEIVEQNGGILGRYGGEEFIMAFLNKKVDDVLPIVEEIHEKIKNAELSHNGEIVKINVSIGVTDYPDICMNPADLLNHADWAMYYSKQHGRGRITVDSEKVQSESLM